MDRKTENTVKTQRNKKGENIKYIVERVYVGDKQVEDVFEGILEHVIEDNVRASDINNANVI